MVRDTTDTHTHHQDQENLCSCSVDVRVHVAILNICLPVGNLGRQCRVTKDSEDHHHCMRYSVIGDVKDCMRYSVIGDVKDCMRVSPFLRRWVYERSKINRR